MDDDAPPAPTRGAARVYTRTGDAGATRLVGGQSVQKDDLRLEAYGTVDELNAVVGLCREAARAHPEHLAGLDPVLERIQNLLFDLGSRLATQEDDPVLASLPVVGDAEVRWLEEEMDRCSKELRPLRAFVLPGGSGANANLHLARTVCRRTERLVVRLHREGGCGAKEVRFLNRLSDAFFVWARWAAHRLEHDETPWTPRKDD